MTKPSVNANFLLHKSENFALTRVCSLLLAVVFSGLILFNPHLITNDPSNIKHGLLSLQMIAICCAFVHGIGFSAGVIYFKLLLSPFWHWPMMLSLLLY